MASSEKGATGNVMTSELEIFRMAEDQKGSMLGQYVNYQNGRYGSIFKNEMLFHMYTRTKDGFCALCDLEPENISKEEGYKEPGDLFHSEGKEFNDQLFHNWNSDRIFVRTETQQICTNVFQYDNEGEALESCLNIEYILKLLCGAEEFSPCCKDFFFFSQDSQVGLMITHWLGCTVQWPSDLPEGHFQLNLDDLSTLPLGVVSGLGHGYHVFPRFHSDTLSIEELEEKVRLFGELIENQEKILPKELRDVRWCTILVHMGRYWQGFEKTKAFNSFESAFEHVKICSENLKKTKWGEQMVLVYDVLRGDYSDYYERLMFAGENGNNSEIIKKIKELPKGYRKIKEEHIRPHDTLCKIRSDLTLLLKEFQKFDSRQIRELKITFKTGFKEFQNKWAKAIDAYKSKTGPVDCMSNELDKFMNSDLNPERWNSILISLIEDFSFCFVTYSSQPKKVNGRPNALLDYICPASWEEGCPSYYQSWTCKTCVQKLRFDPTSSEVNCPCGSETFNACVFRCDHPDHGVSLKSPNPTVNVDLQQETGPGWGPFGGAISGSAVLERLMWVGWFLVISVS